MPELRAARAGDNLTDDQSRELHTTSRDLTVPMACSPSAARPRAHFPGANSSRPAAPLAFEPGATHAQRDDLAATRDLASDARLPAVLTAACLPSRRIADSNTLAGASAHI